MTLKQNKLFWDLDNTLVHSRKADSENHADKMIDMYGEHWKGVKFCLRGEGWDSTAQWFVSFLRNGSLDLLQYSRELLGVENVCMLTLGPFDYACWVNMEMELGFDPNENLYARESIAKFKGYPKFKDTFNVLIDNENYLHHVQDKHGIKYDWCKVVWLNNLPSDNFIQIPEFTVWDESPYKAWTDSYVEDTKTKIQKAFNYEQTNTSD